MSEAQYGISPINLHVCAFKGLQNLPLYVAQREGYFARLGLAVAISYTTGSAAQLAGLAHGEYQLIQTAPDNVINFDTNPAAFGGAPTDAPHVVMLLGGSNGPLGVFGRPGVTTLNGLRGATLGVDNPTSGFALVLRDLLLRQGLRLGDDYSFVVVGSTNLRLGALLRGEVAATILYPPFDGQALAQGCHQFASSRGTYSAYASLATAALQPWLAANSETATRYCRAILQALRWLYDPTNADAALAILRDEPALTLDTSTAQLSLAAFVSPDDGFGLDARLDMAGLRQVIAIRSTLGGVGAALGEPERYVDMGCYERARAAEGM